MNADHAGNDSRLEQRAPEFLERRQPGEQPSLADDRLGLPARTWLFRAMKVEEQ